MSYFVCIDVKDLLSCFCHFIFHSVTQEVFFDYFWLFRDHPLFPHSADLTDHKKSGMTHKSTSIETLFPGSIFTHPLDSSLHIHNNIAKKHISQVQNAKPLRKNCVLSSDNTRTHSMLTMSMHSDKQTCVLFSRSLWVKNVLLIFSQDTLATSHMFINNLLQSPFLSNLPGPMTSQDGGHADSDEPSPQLDPQCTPSSERNLGASDPDQTNAQNSSRLH